MKPSFTFLVFLFCFFLSVQSVAQRSNIPGSSELLRMSLEQAQAYALENNYDLINSATDVEIARKMVKQNTAIGLPQINAGVDYLDYLVIPTQMIPNFFTQPPNPSELIPVKFGATYNMSLKSTLTQLLYSGQYLVGLQTAKAYLETSKQKNLKDKVDVRDLIADIYFRLLVVDEGIKILDSTYMVVSKLVEEIRKSYKVGILEDIEVDQAELNRSNLWATLTYTKNQRTLVYANLKFIIGLKDNQELELTDNLNYFLAQVNPNELLNQQFDYQSNIDYKLLKKADYLTLMQYKLSKTTYQPTLSGFLGASTSAQRNTWSFFNSKEVWYPTVNFGISLQIPIWSSGGRKYAVDQARLNVEKTKVTDEKMRVGLELQVATVRTEFNNAYTIYKNKEKGFETALRIYEKTMEKYQQGMVGSTDLNQRYQQFLSANSDYMQSIYALLSQKIKLSKLLEKF
ncbi:MAG: TolC family protein [Alphaproteobacteria bacterium]|nr:TolC family protein [Alphaproteobacteria bacterium]